MIPVLSACAMAALVSAPEDPVAAADRARRALAERLSASVVCVTSFVPFVKTEENEGFWETADESPFPDMIRHVVASGIVVRDDGLVLCCRTPLTVPGAGFASAFEVETAHGVRYEAELVASEPTINIALLKLKLPEGQGIGDLRPVTMGDPDRLQPGDTIYAVGDPFGSSRVFAPGTVMAMPTASCYQADITGSFIHGSMAVPPGAVGGALVDRNGAAVGLIVPPPTLDPDARPDPLPFTTYAMQIDTVIGVAEALERKRSNESPWMGFSVLSFDEMRRKMRDDAAFEALAKPEHGLFIDDLYVPSPAARVGVKRGDVLVEVNGSKILSVLDFQQALYYFAGTTVPIRVVREGRPIDLMMAIETRPVAANRP